MAGHYEAECCKRIRGQGHTCGAKAACSPIVAGFTPAPIPERFIIDSGASRHVVRDAWATRASSGVTGEFNDVRVDEDSLYRCRPVVVGWEVQSERNRRRHRCLGEAAQQTAPAVTGQAAGSMTQPGTARDLIRLAKEASHQLHDNPDARAINEQIEKSDGKPSFLHVSDQADVGVDHILNRATEVVPVLCPAPSKADGSGQAAAGALQAQGAVPGRTPAESSGMNQSGMEGRKGPGPATACQTGGVTEPAMAMVVALLLAPHADGLIDGSYEPCGDRVMYEAAPGQSLPAVPEGIKPEPGLQPGACGTAETGQGRGTREEPIELSDDTSDEADADDDQDMDVMEPMSGADAPLPGALPESPGTAAHGQAPVAPDVAGPSSAPGPAAEPGSLAAAALVDAAGPGVDPLPHVLEWSSYCVGARTDLSERCLERAPRLVVKHLGLKLEARPIVPILVALALESPHALGADHGHGSLHLMYEVKRRTRGRWIGKKWQLNAWVTNSHFQLTGRFKAQRAGPEQGGPHLLVLEVRPLLQAAAQTDFTTPVCSRAAATPDQPGCSPQATAGVKPRKRKGTEQDVSDGPGKRHGGLVPRMLCVGSGEANPGAVLNPTSGRHVVDEDKAYTEQQGVQPGAHA
ncbi:hypothetical protein QJQ45_006355 [Haematococcus lacustris]|nr:hypothetical protein QJQ45_006355 [Haematococcus lacustris]